MGRASEGNLKKKKYCQSESVILKNQIAEQYCGRLWTFSLLFYLKIVIIFSSKTPSNFFFIKIKMTIFLWKYFFNPINCFPAPHFILCVCFLLLIEFFLHTVCIFFMLFNALDLLVFFCDVKWCGIQILWSNFGYGWNLWGKL